MLNKHTDILDYLLHDIQPVDFFGHWMKIAAIILNNLNWREIVLNEVGHILQANDVFNFTENYSKPYCSRRGTESYRTYCL